MAHAARTDARDRRGDRRDDDLLADEPDRRGHDSGALRHRASPWRASGAWPVGLRGIYPADLEHLRLYAEMATTGARASSATSSELVLQPPPRSGRPRERLRARRSSLIDVAGGHARGLAHVAVGAASPIPGAAALLARERCERHAARLGAGQRAAQLPSPTAARELFDCAAQGRIDAFFLGGGQIDGAANINLVGIGDYPQSRVALRRAPSARPTSTSSCRA